MGNIRIASVNLADEAVLTPGEGAAAMALPLANAQSPLRSRPARVIPGVPTLTILVDFPAPRTVSDIVLWRHNIAVAPTHVFNFRLHAGPGQSGDILYSSDYSAGLGTIPLSSAGGGEPRYATAVDFAPVPGVASMYLFLAAANDVQIELGRLFVGNAIEFETPQDWGGALSQQSNAQQARTEGGSMLSEVRPGWRQLSVGLSFLNEAERAEVLAMAARNRSKDLWISAYPGRGGALERDYSMVGRIVEADGVQAQPYGLFSGRLTIEEI
jgi:hypothetical protein